MNKEYDFKEALEDLQNVSCDVGAMDWFKKHADFRGDAVETALRIADRLQSGEVSEDVVNQAAQYTTLNKDIIEAIYRSMAQQLMKEVKDELQTK